MTPIGAAPRQRARRVGGRALFGAVLAGPTRMRLAGPAARAPYMVTKYSPDGSRTCGMVNNCASGYTPWGTYLHLRAESCGRPGRLRLGADVASVG